MLLLTAGTSCNFSADTSTVVVEEKPDVSKDSISNVITRWHKAAGNANFEEYFNLMTGDGVFIGTDATENWQNEDFRKFSKPYFDSGKAWNFTTLERNIYISDTGETAWFDELLNTQMGICRGSGVLEKENGNWKIKHYVLSIAIPNEIVPEVVQMKKQTDSTIISLLQ